MPPRTIAALAAAAALVGCEQASLQQRHAAALTVTQTAAERQLGQRRYETRDERMVLQAASGVLQDLGFIIDESAPGSGLLIASKQRDATEAGQVASQVILVMLAAVAGARVDPVWERDQRIRVSLVTRPATDGRSTLARVTFQRVIWNTKNQISRVESISDPAIYRKFFDELSQSCFLEAHDI